MWPGLGFLASQCVQLSDRERDIIAETGMRVSHMPLANCEVGGGIAPIPELADAGVTIGLGSDGYVNDFYEVMRGAFLVHKGSACRIRERCRPSQVLHMATEGGARALDLDHVGPPGARDGRRTSRSSMRRLPTPLTAHNLAEQLVLWRNHTHVRDVMVAGQLGACATTRSSAPTSTGCERRRTSRLVASGAGRDVAAIPLAGRAGGARPLESAVSLLRELLEAVDARRPVVLATVVDSSRSVPRRPGSKMLVYADGSITGSVGGGEMEARVVREVDGRARRTSTSTPVLLPPRPP